MKYREFQFCFGKFVLLFSLVKYGEFHISERRTACMYSHVKY